MEKNKKNDVAKTYADYEKWMETRGKYTALYAPIHRISELSKTYPVICCQLSGGKDSMLTTYSLFYAKRHGMIKDGTKLIISHTDCEWEWSEVRRLVVDTMLYAETLGIRCDYKALPLKWENLYGGQTISWINGNTPDDVPTHLLCDGSHICYGMDQRDEQTTYSWRLAAEYHTPVLMLVSIRIAESMARRSMLKNLADKNGVYGWTSCKFGPTETASKACTVKTGINASPVYDLTNYEAIYFALNYCTVYKAMATATNSFHDLRVASLLNTHASSTDDIRRLSPETYAAHEDLLHESRARSRTVQRVISEANKSESNTPTDTTDAWWNAIKHILTMYSDTECKTAISELRRGMRLKRFPHDETCARRIALSLASNALTSDWHLKRHYDRRLKDIKLKYKEELTTITPMG